MYTSFSANNTSTNPSLRDVQVELFNIQQTHDTSDSKPRLLESALIKTEDIENLPKLRERASNETSEEDLNFAAGRGSADEERTNNKKTRRSKLPLHTDEAAINDDGEDGSAEYRPSKEGVVGAKKERTARKSTSKSPAVKKKRGRPRKVLTEEERRIQEERMSMPKRPRGRPKKGQEQRKHHVTPFDYVTSRPKKKATKHRRIIYDPVVKKAAPLMQVKPRGGHKPLDVEIERLVTETNKGKRYKVNTLDVLKHLILNFEPEPSTSTSINANIAHEEFRSHLMNHLGHLFDVHGSIDDLTYEINKVQKQKEELRSKIFELRKDHAAVGSELNSLRLDFRSSKQNYEEFSALAQGLDRLRQEVASSKSSSHDMAAEIDRCTREVGKIYNPRSGLELKLQKVNTVLMAVDNELR